MARARRPVPSHVLVASTPGAHAGTSRPAQRYGVLIAWDAVPTTRQESRRGGPQRRELNGPRPTSHRLDARAGLCSDSPPTHEQCSRVRQPMPVRRCGAPARPGRAVSTGGPARAAPLRRADEGEAPSSGAGEAGCRRADCRVARRLPHPDGGGRGSGGPADPPMAPAIGCSAELHSWSGPFHQSCRHRSGCLLSPSLRQRRDERTFYRRVRDLRQLREQTPEGCHGHQASRYSPHKRL